MKRHFLAAIAASLIFTACSPRVGRIITKTYPVNETDAPVAVFMHPSLAPVNSEALGVVSITDTGFSTKCDSVTVVELLKEEARKVGGNAVAVTEYIRPSIWKSSCHQMTGTVLRVHDFNSFAQTTDADSAQLATIKVIQPERKLPKITLSADLGYGWRVAPLSPNLDAATRDYYQGLKSGWVGDVAVKYYFSDFMGVGLTYSAYNASQSKYGYIDDTSGYLNTNDLVQFIGPVFLTRTPFKDDKWILNADVGIGYLGYLSKSTFPGVQEKLSGATAGMYCNMGLEYRLKPNLGIGLNLSALTGVVTDFTKDTNGYKEHFTLDRKEGEGLGQFQLLAGIRYYIK